MTVPIDGVKDQTSFQKKCWWYYNDGSNQGCPTGIQLYIQLVL